MFANRLQSLTGLRKAIYPTTILRFSTASATIKNKMQKHQVVPDVIPIAPIEVAKVTYVSGVLADLGNELTPAVVKDIPKVEWNADASALYTLCLTDPDAPSRQEPTYREVRLISFYKKAVSNVYTYIYIYFPAVAPLVGR